MVDKYQEFLTFLFDRIESTEDWRFDFELIEPDLSGEEIVAFTKRMLENYETDLTKYSDWQLALGVEYIFSNTCSNISFFLRDGPSDIQERVEAIKALKVFSKQCLNTRCEPLLGHLSESKNKLNYLCYMLWDVTPLTYCEQIKEKKEIYDAVADVMKFSLSLSNIACIESGLHGLGHLELYYDEAPNIVRQFMNNNPGVDKRLLEYAENAEKGHVQ